MGFCGIFEVLFGLLGLAKFFTLIPSTGLIGFLNGLAIIMFVAQLSTFKECKSPNFAGDFEGCLAEDQVAWMQFSEVTVWLTLFEVILTMIITHFWEKVPKIGSLVPGSLVAIFFGTAFEHCINRPLIGHDIRTVGENAQLDLQFPPFGIPDLGGSANWGVVLKYAFMLMAIGLFESILTLQTISEIHKTPVTAQKSNKECIAQGVANVVCGLFRTQGGGGTIGEALINTMNGGKFRLSSASPGVFLLIIVLVASPLIKLIPVACLTGVIFVIVLHTWYWPTFRLLFQLHLEDSFTIILVTVLAVLTNLAIAIVSGIVWQALVSVWKSSKLLFFKVEWESDEYGETFVTKNEPKISDDERESHSITKVYHLHGPLMFSSAPELRTFFNFGADPDLVAIDFEDCSINDYSAVSAIREVTKQYRESGKHVTLRNISNVSHHELSRDRIWAYEKLGDDSRGIGRRDEVLQSLNSLYTGSNSMDEPQSPEPEPSVEDHHDPDHLAATPDCR